MTIHNNSVRYQLNVHALIVMLPFQCNVPLKRRGWHFSSLTAWVFSAFWLLLVSLVASPIFSPALVHFNSYLVYSSPLFYPLCGAVMKQVCCWAMELVCCWAMELVGQWSWIVVGQWSWCAFEQ